MNKLEDVKFYGILDTLYVEEKDFLKKANELIAGGAGIVQLRAKNSSRDEKRKLLEIILPVFKQTNIPLIINDDIDLALEYEGLGLHIGQDDLDAYEARRLLGRNRILGLSTHSLDQAKGAIEKKDILNYFAVGPIFPTDTKKGRPSVGLDLITQVNELNPPLPFFTIGGINLENVELVKKAGAKRVVIVSGVLKPEDTKKAVQDFIKKI